MLLDPDIRRYQAYAGHLAFFSFISELKDPRDFPKALYLLQICATIIYIVVAVVVYRYAGSEVMSPAIGSIQGVVKKVAYGIALPTVRANIRLEINVQNGVAD